MRSKKIAAILAITLTGSYVIPTNAIASTVTNKTVLVQQVQAENKQEGTTDNKKNNTNKSLSTNVKANESENNSTQNLEVTNGISINKNQIILNNVWNQNIGTISFNGETQKIEFNGGGSLTNPYLSRSSEAFGINLYNSNGIPIKSMKVYGDEYPQNQISEFLNDNSYQYGEYIEIDYKTSSKIDITNFNGQNNFVVQKPIILKITKNGLEQSNIRHVPVDPFDVLEGLVNVTSGVVTGKVNPNEVVKVTVNGKVFTGESNSNGNYSINVDDSNGFTSQTKIELKADGYLPNTITPVLNSDIKIANSDIQIINAWGSQAGLIKFNPNTQKIEVSQYNRYLGHNSNEFLNIKIYDPSTEKMILSKSLNGNDNTSALSSILNNLSFNYGDKLIISYDSSQGKVNVNNGDNSIGNKNGTKEVFTINKGGLIKSNEIGVPANPFAILNGLEKITSGVLTGKVKPNEMVKATVNGKVFEGKSDANGEYSINIVDSNGFTYETKIELKADGYLPNTIIPIINDKIQIQNTTISFSNNWHNNIGTIKFNPDNQKIEFENGGAGTNPYLASTGEAFEIGLYNANGSLIKSMEVYGSSYPQSKISEFLNNVSYQYGEYIELNHVNSTNINIQNSNGKNYNVSGDELFEITKTGLVKSNIQRVKVNPFDYLSGTDVKSGTVTGTAIPNQEVSVIINGKTFTGKSDSNGKFSINITSNLPFTENTPINVWANNELTNIIYPVAPINWEIANSKIQLPDPEFGISETMTFNPTKMQIENSGSGFATQLIDGSNGNLLASNSDGNFNAFNSKNDINNANFKFGDIINVYESDETYLSDSYVNLYNGNNESSIEAVNQFKGFEITKNGLVPVANKNLTNTNALYNGNSEVVVSGKTMPNINVDIAYGNNENKTIKSNDEGEFSVILPVAEAQVGSIVRLFVNGQNNQELIVGYNSKKFNANNGIQLVNDESVPVINFTFSPATKTINALVYPRDKTYAGVFYGNRVSMSLLNGKTGAVVKTATSENPGEIQSFANQLNGEKYSVGDIIKVQYDNSLVSVDVSNDNKQIGNANGQVEYFEITNKGLINVTNKFINIKPLAILGNAIVKTATINGTVSPNENVTAVIDGKTFTTKANSKGVFALSIENEKGFTSSTNIVLSANGYMETTILPTVNDSINLENSYINFYENSFNWEATSLCSSIGFNVSDNTFTVNNYEDNFGAGNSNYFTLGLYNKNGKNLFSKSFNGGVTSQLSSFLDGKKFTYGDIIELTYNSSVYKPIAVNGNNVISNVTGAKEYFEITKDGLEKITFGAQALANKITWNNGNLQITTSLAAGNSSKLTNESKKIVLINSNNNVIASENVINSNGENIGTLTAKDLENIKQGETYSIALEAGNTIIPIYTNINTPSENGYNLYASSTNKLTISHNVKYVDIKSANDITSYLNNIEKDVNSININNLENSPSNSNKILASQFINRVGLSNLVNFYNTSAQNANFLNWVLNNSTAMEEFLSGPNPDGAHEPEGQPPATYEQCLQVWSNIWNTYTNSHSGFNLRLAIAVALTNGQPIAAFPDYFKTVGSPVVRYNIFENLNAEGGMMSGFDKFDVSHLCYVVNTDIANDQIKEARNIILQNHNGLLTPASINALAYTINYNSRNPHTGVSVFNYANFYGPNPTIKDVWYDGGVCGATGRMGAACEQVFGVPAVQTPQTGHNAFIYYDSLNNTWQIGNAVDGWSQTYDADMSSWSNILCPNDNMIASYTELYQAADNGTLQKSNMYLYLASIQTNYNDKLNSIKQAMKIDNLNMGAWIALVNLYNSNPSVTMEQYNELATQAQSIFKDYSMPMTNLVHYIYSNILQEAISQANLSFNSSNLKSQIANANEILQNANASQSDILSAIKSLGYKNLNLQKEINSLKAEILKGQKDLNQKIYTANSVNTLENAIKLAQNTINLSNPTMIDVLSNLKNVNNAIDGLLMISSENQLKLDIASANSMMNNSGYTLGSKNALGEAINAGNAVLANKNATSDEITSAINSLIAAYKGLVVDTAGLKNDVKEAQTLVNSGNYTKESELSLENAIKAGENLLASKEINVFSVENVINQLNSAAKSLVVQKKEAPQKVEIENNAQTLYFANISGMESLVINGNIDGVDTPANVSKELIIESSNGQVIDTINTTPVNWYSKNKENYSGYQGIISGNILSKLEVGENYKVGIKYDGQVHMLNSKITMPSYGQYRVENSNGNVVIQKSSVIQEGVANCEMGYVYNNGFIINANVNLNGDVIPASAQKQIVITDENGKVVYESNTIPVNWYSSNKNDYSGLQAYIPQSELSKLNATTNYKVSILVTEGSKKYSMPVKGFANVSTDGYKLYDNGDTLSITKVQNVTASAKVEDKYQDGNSTVINAMMNIENVPAGSSAMLKVTEKDGTVKDVNGVLVNWYSKDKNNLNGVQFVVNSKIIENAKSSNIVVSVGNKNYNCSL